MPYKPSIYLNSITRFSGKTALGIGLAIKLKKEGYRVGYFKPIGWETTQGPHGERIDEDAHLMKDILELDTSLENIVPIIFSSRYFEENARIKPRVYEKKVLQAYDVASKDKDLMIIEGLFDGVGVSFGLDATTLSQKIGSNMVLVSTLDTDANVDSIICNAGCMKQNGAKVLGTILNRVQKTDIERVKSFAVPNLRKKGIQVLGIIPDDVTLRSPSVNELCDEMTCTVLSGTKNMDNIIEEFLVGAMTPESALRYFRSSLRKAVITGGDRTDIQLAALQTDTVALILTGNYYPDARVLARAEEFGVPVLMVSTDTYSTVKKISSLIRRIRPHDTQKIELASQMVEQYVDYKAILKGIIPDKS